MAKQTRNIEVEERETLVDPKTIKLPEGFEELSGERCLGFFMIQSGNAIQGFLRGSFEVDSKFKTKDGSGKKKVYKIEVTSVNPTGKGATVFMPAKDADDYPDGCAADVGDLIGLDEKGFLQSLREVPEGAEVWVCCYGKEPPSDAYPQGAWKFKVMVKKSIEQPAT